MSAPRPFLPIEARRELWRRVCSELLRPRPAEDDEPNEERPTPDPAAPRPAIDAD